MTVRTRILLACLFVALLPLSVFVVGARREVQARLTSGFEARVAASSSVIRQDLSRQSARVELRLRALAERLVEDPQQRAALLQHTDAALLAAHAAGMMPVAGLDYLLLVDGGGRVLGSGHFRGDFDREFASLDEVTSAAGPVLIAARRPQGTFVVLADAHTFQLAGQRFTLVGGDEVDEAFVRVLARDTANLLVVSLAWPGGVITSDAGASAGAGPAGFAEQIELPFIDDAGTAGSGPALLTISHSMTPLHTVRRAMDTWFLAAAAAAILLAFISARVLAARVNRPLEELARRSTRINLERLDTSFATRRRDEIGTLSRMLDTMVQRLRASAGRLRDAERRATVGDMARQVNHDIRNGLLPIRNVVQHLSEVAHDDPAQLGPVFAEREGTLRGGIGYLESLAASYARITPQAAAQRCDVNGIVRDAAGHAGERVQLRLAPTPLHVSADPIALRRIVENLTVNAVQSLENGSGSVVVETGVADAPGGRRVVITVADTGTGIEPQALDLIFNDFYTTKEQGTGLGLSIVRRLVADMSGRIGVESRRGSGTTFRIELPEAT